MTTLATRQPLPTSSGLIAEARHVVIPRNITSSGFPRIQATCREIGIHFDGWQVDLNRVLLAKTADGLYAADTVALSIPRQVGKTFDIGAVMFAECIATPGTTVVWTAHRFKVSRETFNELRGWAKSPKLAPHIDYDAITTGTGNECIPFNNGSRIVFAARERGSIRGFTKVRILVLDEAQILTDSVLADLTPTMNQAINPLIILMGTPPKPSDPGEVFTNLRTEALSGESEGTLFVEFSAAPGSDPDDREAWHEANPSYPTRTPARSMLRMRKLLTEDDFRREALGIWDSDGGRSVVPSEAWQRCEDPDSTIISTPQFALDIPPTRDAAAIAVAGTNLRGRMHVEITVRNGVVDFRDRTEWVLPRLGELHTSFPSMKLQVAAGSAGETLRPEIEALGITVEVVPFKAVAAACGLFFDLSMRLPEPGLAHIGQESLTNAVASARKRQDNGEGAWIWGRRRSGAHITGLYAATLALGAAQQSQGADYDVADSIF